MSAVAEIPFEYSKKTSDEHDVSNEIKYPDSEEPLEIQNNRPSLGNRPSFNKVFNRVLGSNQSSGCARAAMQAP